MAGPYDFTGQNIENTYQRVLQTPDGVTFYNGTGSLVTLPSANTSSLLTTASVNLNTITFTKGDGSTFPITVNTGSGGSGTPTFPYTGSAIISGSLTITGSLNAPSITGSLLGTASWAYSSSQAITASYALNGGVTQLLAGANITLTPTNGLGQVTITSTGGGGGGNTATGSYGSFYSTVTQTNVAGTARSMSLNITDISNGVSISGSTNPFNTYIKTENPGVYDIQFSAQVDKTDSGTDEIWIWLRKNGVNVDDSATSVQLVGNGAHYVAAWNFFVNSSANDYYQLMWYSPDANVRLHAEASFGVVPGIPSLILTVNRIDTFLSNTGSFSGSFTGNLTGTASYATTASYSLSASYVSPGGSNTYVQFNSNNTFAGDPSLTYDSNKQLNTLRLNVTGRLVLEGIVTIDNNSSPYTVETDTSVILCDTSAGPIDIDIDSTAVRGRILTIKDIGNASSNNITFKGSTIDGGAFSVINIDKQSIIIYYSIGYNTWYIIGSHN